MCFHLASSCCLNYKSWSSSQTKTKPSAQRTNICRSWIEEWGPFQAIQLAGIVLKFDSVFLFIIYDVVVLMFTSLQWSIMSERQNCIALPASTRVQYQHYNGNIIHIKCTQCLSQTDTESMRREIISSLKLLIRISSKLWWWR